jgi:hypothetical protein
MCPYARASLNIEYIRDLTRGRGWDRFYKLEKFANKRWRDTRDMRRASQWLAILGAINRRKPY